MGREHPFESIVVPREYTLTIEPGTIIKTVYSTGGFTIKGTLIARGTEENPIIFTSFYDDECGGDTNGDGNKVEYCSTAEPDDARNNNCPRAGYWGQIIFEPSSTNSVLDYVIIRYGGKKWMSAPNYSKEDYVLKIENSDLALTNSVIENNTSGFWLEGSNSTINASTFLNNKLGLRIGANSFPILLNLVFENNEQDVEDLRPKGLIASPALVEDSQGYAKFEFTAVQDFSLTWRYNEAPKIDIIEWRFQAANNQLRAYELKIDNAPTYYQGLLSYIPEKNFLDDLSNPGDKKTFHFTAGNSYSVYLVREWIEVGNISAIFVKDQNLGSESQLHIMECVKGEEDEEDYWISYVP